MIVVWLCSLPSIVVFQQDSEGKALALNQDVAAIGGEHVWGTV